MRILNLAIQKKANAMCFIEIVLAVNQQIIDDVMALHNTYTSGTRKHRGESQSSCVGRASITCHRTRIRTQAPVSFDRATDRSLSRLSEGSHFSASLRRPR